MEMERWEVRAEVGPEPVPALQVAQLTTLTAPVLLCSTAQYCGEEPSWRRLPSPLYGMFMLAAAHLLHTGKSVGFRTFLLLLLTFLLKHISSFSSLWIPIAKEMNVITKADLQPK